MFFIFADFQMIELRCDLSLALALGAEVPGTQKYIERFRDDDGAISVFYSADTPPLYWPWQLGRLDRMAARRTPRRDE
jgi:hypothetical protein